MIGNTHPFAGRFVDRDMFMRYRGGGIGHTYMRAIEQVYENMSRERIHHKAPKQKDVPPDKDTPMGVEGFDGIDDDEGEGEGEDEAPTAAASTSGTAILTGDALNEEDDSEGDEDDEYRPDSDSYSSGISNSDDLDSDETGGGYESYELGDL